jgi:hypothetical protein
MSWFKIIVKDEAVAGGGITTIMNAFECVMPLGDASKGCALFMRDETDASVVFISPQFAAIAPQLIDTFSARECQAPPPRREGEEFGTALMLASHSTLAWSLLS